LTSSWAS